MKRLRMILILGLLLMPVNAFAETSRVEDTNTRIEATDTQALQRWQKLSPAEQQALRERYQQYQALPAEEQQQLQQNLLRFKAMDPQQQQGIHERFKRWQGLPLEQREQLRQTYQDFKQLTPEQQQQLRQDLEQLKSLPEEERSQRTQQLRQDYMGGQRQMSPTGGMQRQPMRRMPR